MSESGQPSSDPPVEAVDPDDETDGSTVGEVTPTANPAGVLATQGSLVYEPLLRAGGQRHIDTPRMIDTLQALNANTYVFPITDRATNWSDLVDEFLPAAAEAGIDVWVQLYAPSEPVCCSVPFGTNYVRWARGIAEASVAHPNLTGWMISNYWVDLGIDDIETAGFALDDAGVEAAGLWTPGLARQGNQLYCSSQTYHRDYGADVSAAVAGLYGSS